MSKSQPVEKSSTSSTSIPAWLTSAAQGVASDATSLPTYQPYTGQFAAPLTGNQNTAIGQAGSNVGQASGIIGLGIPGAQNASTFSAAPITTGGVNADTQGLLSPYIQNVVDTTNKEIDRNHILTQQNSDAQAGANHVFSGDRAGVVQAMNDRDYGDLKARTDAGLYSQGFTAAQAAALGLNQANQNASINSAGINVAGANALTGAGAGVSNANTADVNGLLTTGDAAQKTNQLQDTMSYQDYMNQYNAALQRLQTQSGALSALPHDSTTNGTETSQVYSNALGPILGLGLGIAGLGTGGGATLGGSLISGLLGGSK